MLEFHAEEPQATVTVSEGLAQGSFAAVRAGVEPMTLRTKGVDSTNAPPTPHKFFQFLRLSDCKFVGSCDIACVGAV